MKFSYLTAAKQPEKFLDLLFCVKTRDKNLEKIKQMKNTSRQTINDVNFSANYTLCIWCQQYFLILEDFIMHHP